MSLRHRGKLDVFRVMMHVCFCACRHYFMSNVVLSMCAKHLLAFSQAESFVCAGMLQWAESFPLDASWNTLLAKSACAHVLQLHAHQTAELAAVWKVGDKSNNMFPCRNVTVSKVIPFGCRVEKSPVSICSLQNIFQKESFSVCRNVTVREVIPFGCIMEYSPGKTRLCHVAQLDINRTADPTAVWKVGDKMDVKLIEFDEKTGRCKLSRYELNSCTPYGLDANFRIARLHSCLGPLRFCDVAVYSIYCCIYCYICGYVSHFIFLVTS